MEGSGGCWALQSQQRGSRQLSGDQTQGRTRAHSSRSSIIEMGKGFEKKKKKKKKKKKEKKTSPVWVKKDVAVIKSPQPRMVHPEGI